MEKNKNLLEWLKVRVKLEPHEEDYVSFVLNQASKETLSEFGDYIIRQNETRDKFGYDGECPPWVINKIKSLTE